MQSKGVEIISNNSLRNSISLPYERSYPYYKRYEEERLRFHAMHSEPKLLEYFSMHFKPTNKYYADFKISQEDYNKLRNDTAFAKLLKLEGNPFDELLKLKENTLGNSTEKI